MAEEWVEIRVVSPQGAEELVAELLHGAGATGTVLADTLDPSRTGDAARGDTVVSGYFPGEANMEAVTAELNAGLAMLFSRLGVGRPPVVRSRPVRPEDWVESWKRYYHVTHVDDHLVVVPEWEEYDPSPGETIIRINPGMAFGSGTHDSTRFALQAVRRVVTREQPSSMLDVGTGSGILAIAALKLGVREAVGVDVETHACRQAAHNARLNGLIGRLSLVVGDVSEQSFGRPFPLVTANLTSDLLSDLAPLLRSVTTQGGTLIASGITRSRETAVAEALKSAGLGVVDGVTNAESEWVCLVCQRETAP